MEKERAIAVLMVTFGTVVKIAEERRQPANNDIRDRGAIFD